MFEKIEWSDRKWIAKLCFLLEALVNENKTSELKILNSFQGTQMRTTVQWNLDGFEWSGKKVADSVVTRIDRNSQKSSQRISNLKTGKVVFCKNKNVPTKIFEIGWELQKLSPEMQFPQIQVGAHGSTYARVWKARRELKYYFYSKSKRTRYTLFQFKTASNTQQKQVTRPTKKPRRIHKGTLLERTKEWNVERTSGFFQKKRSLWNFSETSGVSRIDRYRTEFCKERLVVLKSIPSHETSGSKSRHNYQVTYHRVSFNSSHRVLTTKTTTKTSKTNNIMEGLHCSFKCTWCNMIIWMPLESLNCFEGH